MAILLPWSTSATLIGVGLWALAWVLTFEVRRCGGSISARGSLPCAVVAARHLGLALVRGFLARTVGGFAAISQAARRPLLLVQFRESRRCHWILLAFLVSCTALLALSFGFELTGFTWRFSKERGVPVRDVIAQSGEFLLCGFALLAASIAFYRNGQHRVAAGSLLLSLLFFLNLIYVASARTTIVVAFVIMIFVACRLFAGIQRVAVAFMGTAILLASTFGSPQVRDRIDAFWQQLELRQNDSDQLTSTAIRLEMWRRSFSLVNEAPVFGHGTGSIRKLFRESAKARIGIDGDRNQQSAPAGAGGCNLAGPCRRNMLAPCGSLMSGCFFPTACRPSSVAWSSFRTSRVPV